jgi:hypothetical protein
VKLLSESYEFQAAIPKRNAALDLCFRPQDEFGMKIGGNLLPPIKADLGDFPQRYLDKKINKRK